MSASTSTVVCGSFTISVGGNCYGKVDLSVSGGFISTNSIWVDNDYQTVTVTAGSSGNVTVVATPVKGFSDPNENEYYPGKRTVSVTIVQPQKPSDKVGEVHKYNNLVNHKLHKINKINRIRKKM